eukprot:3009942-Amphidinium_carterae.1
MHPHSRWIGPQTRAQGGAIRTKFAAGSHVHCALELHFDIAAASTHSWSADYHLPAAPYKAHIADGRSQLPWSVQ